MKKLYIILGLFSIFILEYLTYIYFTSQKIFDIDALLKAIISIIIFTIFFYKTIWKKYCDTPNSSLND